MIRLLLILTVMLSGCTACGHSTTDSELTGQIKKVIKRTPLVCPDYVEADISLGVMRNGVGSMSHEDMQLRVMNVADIPALEKAARDGSIVRAVYDTHRVAICYPREELTAVTVEADPATPPPAPAPPKAPPPDAAPAPAVDAACRPCTPGCNTPAPCPHPKK